MLQCDECRRWMYIEETDFGTYEQAEESTDRFECKICEKFQVYDQKLNDQRETLTRMEERNQTLGKIVENLTTQLGTLSEKLTTLQNENDKLRERSGATQEASQGNTVKSAECETKMEIIESLINRVEMLEKENGELQAEKQMAEGRASVATKDRGQQDGLSPPREHPQKPPMANEVASNSQAKEKNTGEGDRRPGTSTTQKRVTIIGDSNVNRVKRPLLREINRDRRVNIIGISGAKTNEILEEMSKMPQNEGEENLVIIMAGLNDVLSGQEPEQITSALTDIGNQWLEDHPNGTLGICSIPFTKERGQEVQAKIRQVNKNMQTVCHSAPRMLFLNNYHILRTAESSGIVDIHFSPEGSERVAQLIAQKIDDFLEVEITNVRSRQMRREYYQPPHMPMQRTSWTPYHARRWGPQQWHPRRTIMDARYRQPPRPY
ncbi:uncharacterized protein LOC135378432 [Ornithodoros turicata]|uniref:uncharacterized protein LOC135378432 n=1 Tax=Ornithodoros turicata TaxID=34597 RepID=UPI003139AD02